MLVEDVIDALKLSTKRDPSKSIGDAVMQRLRRVDQVAYVRFASVYKEFAMSASSWTRSARWQAQAGIAILPDL